MYFDTKLSKNFGEAFNAPVQEIGIDPRQFSNAPPMNINIMIVGSRGDVQPYLVFGEQLQLHVHQVRLFTHETFRKLVRDTGLWFFNIDGGPHELLSYMVRDPGLIPGFESLKNGDIAKKQKLVVELLNGCWGSCHEADDDIGGGTLFAADATISNRPAFAHIYCTEALGIPLLMSFTMPWCSTAAFPHPLANIKQTNAKASLTNCYSFRLVKTMTRQGLGHMVNEFRIKRLGLGYLSTASVICMIERCGTLW
ncbi:UDP-Glycosyltransferase/glycogen phosphorylase [Ceratobasidium sp. AG-I]|nr:UDP-Glycosyltransferase/glycogen phosphorylase [Ceratobasidium sp. AG-I]